MWAFASQGRGANQGLPGTVSANSETAGDSLRPYIDEFVAAVPTDKGDTYLAHTKTAWPDKPTRETAWAKMMSDPAMAEAMGDMPFDGKRMIFGEFDPILMAGASGPS